MICTIALSESLGWVRGGSHRTRPGVLRAPERRAVRGEENAGDKHRADKEMCSIMDGIYLLPLGCHLQMLGEHHHYSAGTWHINKLSLLVESLSRHLPVYFGL